MRRQSMKTLSFVLVAVALVILIVPALVFATTDTVTLSWSGGTGAIANENPKVTYTYLGQQHTVFLSQTPTAYQIDDGSTITPQSPWTSDAMTFTAAPTSVAATPGLTENFAYGTTAPKTCTQMGSNTTALFESGQCLIPAIVWSFGNILGEPVLLEFFVVIPGIVTYIKPRSGALALIMMAVIQGSISQMLGIPTPTTLTIVAATAVLTVSGGIVKVLWGGGATQ